MQRKVRWGVLGAAKIATKKVIPAMQQGRSSEIVAIASRDVTKAREAAESLGIGKWYGSYEELLRDPEVEAVYNPLPNHLHVPWSAKAAEAGKHVLCEKPIALSTEEAKDLLRIRDRTKVKIGEAFMVHSHPQWLRARQLVRSGDLGELKSIIAAFSYFNRNPQNIRNIPEYGGGALMDIGCYPITIARFLFGEEPARVMGLIDRDPEMRIDRLTSGMLQFRSGHAVFTCSTQMVPYQRVQVLGTRKRLEIEIPFNAPPDRPCRLFTGDGTDLTDLGRTAEEFPICNQYTLQGERFSEAILNDGEVPTPLEDSIQNMRVIEGVFEAAKNGKWVDLA